MYQPPCICLPSAHWADHPCSTVPIIMPSAIDADALSGTLPSSVGGTHELLLTNRICQRWYDVLDYVYTLQKIVTHLAKRLCLSLAGFEDTGCHVCELLCGEEHVTRSWRWPPAQRKKRTEVLNLANWRGLNSANNTVSEEVDPSPLSLRWDHHLPRLWLQLWKILNRRTQLNCSQRRNECVWF